MVLVIWNQERCSTSTTCEMPQCYLKLKCEREKFEPVSSPALWPRDTGSFREWNQYSENYEEPILSRQTSFSDSSTPQLKYADVSRGLQNIFTEKKCPLSIECMEAAFASKFALGIHTIVGVSTLEYIRRKENIFSYNEETAEVYLQPNILAGPPIPDPAQPKDEAFVVREFENLIQDSGPICYISSLCGKFIQRNGVSVTSITNSRPIDVIKRHPAVFILVGGGNVTLRKFEQHVLQMIKETECKGIQVPKPTEEAPPIPDVISADDVVREFRRLILQDCTDQVYISSLCGRFLQRFKVPVSKVIGCRPAEFLRKRDDIFVMTGAGNVGLREVLGHEIKSVPSPPPREEKAKLLNKTLLLVEVVEEIRQKLGQGSFLAVDSVEIGGSVGKGLVFQDCADVEIVVFVKRLPFGEHRRWHRQILEMMECVLRMSLEGAGNFRCEDCQLQFSHHDMPVTIRISPVFESDEQRNYCIRSASHDERNLFAPCMIRERVNFIRNQPGVVKKAMKILRWWKRQLRWSSLLSTPSDELIELIVIRASLSLGPMGTELSSCRIIQEALLVMQKLDGVRVLWKEQCLTTLPDDVRGCHPVFVNPMNPFSNMLDPAVFDCSDLEEFAQLQHASEVLRRQGCEISFGFTEN